MDCPIGCGVGQIYGNILIATQHRGAERTVMIAAADHHTGLVCDIGRTAADDQFQGTCGASAGCAEGQVIRFGGNVQIHGLSVLQRVRAVCMAGGIRDHNSRIICVQCPIHMISRIRADQSIAEFSIMAIVIRTVEIFHGGGQLSVGISGCVAVLIGISAALAIGLQHGDIV